MAAQIQKLIDDVQHAVDATHAASTEDARRKAEALSGAREWLASCSVDCRDWSDSDVALVMLALDKQIDEFFNWDGADEFVANLGTQR